MFADQSVTSTPRCNFIIRSKAASAIHTTEDIDQNKELREKCIATRYLDGRYFEVDYEESSLVDGQIVAKCKLCDNMKKSIRGKLGNAANFTSHIKRLHPSRVEEYSRYKRKRSLESSMKLVTTKDPQKIYEENVTRFILHSALPFSIVELASFRKLIDDIPSRKRMKLQHLSEEELDKQLTTTYNRKMQLLCKKLSKIDYVCTTADIWENDTERFFCVTVHWIDPETFKRNSAAIACRRFREPCSANHLGKMIDKIHKSFKLDAKKTVTTITDSGTCFAEAYRELQIQVPSGCFGENELEDFVQKNHDRSPMKFGRSTAGTINQQHDQESVIVPGSIPKFCSTSTLSRHFHCTCRSLNLIATTDAPMAVQSSDVLRSLHKQSLERCEQMWNMFAEPRIREQLTKHWGESFVNSISKKPSSVFRLFDWVLKLNPKLTAACTFLGIDAPLRISDWGYIEEYWKCLSIVATSIEKLQGATDCTFGHVLPTLVSLKVQLMQLSEKHNFLYCRSLMDALIKSVDTRFADYFNIRGAGYSAAVAAIVHPQFKTQWMAHLPETIQNAALKCAAHAAEVISTPRTPKSDSDAKMQLEQYTSEKCPDAMYSIGVYPVIEKLFLCFNAPLSGSTPVERLFSQATMRNAPRLSSLSDEEFERRILSACNERVWRQNFVL